MFTWKWDWMHTALALAIVGSATTLIALGHEQPLMQVIALAGGASGAAALIKQSPRAKSAPTDEEKTTP